MSTRTGWSAVLTAVAVTVAGLLFAPEPAVAVTPMAGAAVAGVVPASAKAVPVGVSTEFTDRCWFEESAILGRPLRLQRKAGSAWVTVARGAITQTPRCLDGGGVVRWKPPRVGRATLRFMYPAYRGERVEVGSAFRVWVVAAPPAPRGPGAAAMGSTGAAVPGGGLWPARVPGLAGAVSVACSGESWFAVMGDGTVRAWGDNTRGQLGDGTTTSRSAPVPVSGLTGVRGIVTTEGWYPSISVFALLADGTVRSWGDNSHGQLGDGTTRSRSVPVPVTGLVGVISVAAAGSSVFAVLGDGTVRVWGDNSRGNLGVGGTDDRHSPVPLTGLTDVTAIDAVLASYDVRTSAYALLRDGTVRAWGDNQWGQLGDGTTTDRAVPGPVAALADVVEVVTGSDGEVSANPLSASAYALLRDGTVRAWGANTWGQVGDASTTHRTSPVPVTGLSDVVAITAHAGSAWAVRSDGTVRAWGANPWAQLGDGTRTSRSTPVTVAGLTKVAAVVAGGQSVEYESDSPEQLNYGFFFSYALRTDGTVWTWGNNDWGQLADGTLTERATPAPVTGLATITAITTGRWGAVALLR